MALIHETLYRTKKFSEVDMESYLGNLVDQMKASLPALPEIQITLNTGNIVLDLPRATPCGLIVNELVTNTFKYAFPPGFDCMKERGAPPSIGIELARSDTRYELRFRDNGIGLPAEFDIAKARSLGLKLINFLARHQMRAAIEVNSRNGTEYLFRFPVSLS